MKKTVVTGMSGGVDSSVAALILKRQGYDVIGLFMHNWEEDDNGVCSAADDWADVQSVCARLEIPCYSVNFSKQYYERVFKYFLDEYANMRTPNPDVLCNREIKFGQFSEYAKTLGADYIATGHYCKALDGNLYKAKDLTKDQSYFLNQVQTGQLQNVLFPLGDMLKSEIRAIAQENDFITARKKDSTGVCFIGERNFKKFLQNYLPAKPGQITDKNGVILGTHDGLMYYTLGQRRGLNIGGKKNYEQNRWYVIGKDVKNNRLIVSCGEGEELLSTGLIGGSLNIIGEFDISKSFKCTAKTRYRHNGSQAEFTYLGGDTFSLKFNEPQRAVTLGQYAVIYDKDRCLGGGVINSTFN